MDKINAARPLEGAVKNVISEIGKKSRFTEEELVSAWKASVGRRASNHAQPAALKKSGLVINVDGSGWLYELTLKKKEILEKLGERLKGNGPKDIRFRIGEVRKQRKI